MAATAGISPVVSQSPSGLGEKDKMLSFEEPDVKKISTQEVYELGKEIAQEMQRVTADYGKGCLEGLVEKVVRSLEWLEVCAVQSEELQKTKCQLLLKEDELAREKERVKKVQMDLKGITLVVEERGRQRDLFASKVSELEIQNKNYQEMINAYEQAQTRKQRSKRYSTIIDENEPMMSFHSRTKSLDRREMKPIKASKTKEKDALIEQLQKELIQEKRRVTELRETGTLDHRRIQQRMKHMEQEIASLNKQLSMSHLQIERLKQEKTALLERSEVLNEVRAIQLATAARQEEKTSQDDGGSSPRFFKKDLLMILKERNELKEKIIGLEEELASFQNRSKGSVRKKPSKERSPRTSKKVASSYCSAPCIQDVWERNEGSMVIIDVPNYYLHQGITKSNSMKTPIGRSSSHSGSDHSLRTNSLVGDTRLNGHRNLLAAAGSQDDIISDDDSTSL